MCEWHPHDFICWWQVIKETRVEHRLVEADITEPAHDIGHLFGLGQARNGVNGVAHEPSITPQTVEMR